ncbi:MAG: response regulator [Reichenbachiella sp.]|uniref:response regulator n=1 Tax=Reichenbachiella sp. TaxID=2184521 RepID=UPI003263AD6D
MIATSYILLIDDDQITNFVNQTIIKKSEVSLDSKAVITGSEGLNFLIKCLEVNEELPHAILLDINMPEMNGWEFLDKFSKLDQRIHEEVKVYVLSSTQNEDDVRNARANPFVTDFLPKPLNFEKIKEVFDH